MRILFIHQNLPGQFIHLIRYFWGRSGWDICGIGERRWVKDNLSKLPNGFPVLVYDIPEKPTSESFLLQTAMSVARGQSVVPVLKSLKNKGWIPDIVYAHPGWGEALFIRDIFPQAYIIHYCEYYYHAHGQDVNFDPEFPSTSEELMELRIRNTHHLLGLESMDLGISPTHWQKQCFPYEFHHKIKVIHDGIDTQRLQPDPSSSLQISNTTNITSKQEIISFVNRNLEPYRGFHIFMRALPEVLKHRPNAQVVIVGGDGVSYGRQPANGTYKTQMLTELHQQLSPFMGRIHFLGKVPYASYVSLLQTSSIHVYLTYPFVLSWSFLEAMCCGGLLLASNTPPIREVLVDQTNGYLFDFFSVHELTQHIIRILEDKEDYRHMQLREQARQTIIDHYDLHRICLPQQIDIFTQTSNKP